MSKEAMKLMVHELEYVLDCINKNKIPFDGDDFHEALRLGRQAIEQAEKQEPVGRVVSANCEYATVQWLRQTSEVGGGDPKNSRSWPIAGDAVYTTPQPQREWVGLTDNEMLMIYGQQHEGEKYSLGRMVEQALKEKNT